MREILFKGKRIADGKWVEGYYYKMSETTYCFKEDYEKNPVPEHHYILQERMTDWGLPNRIAMLEVDPETLCEYTGLTDKNGNEIWENDILKFEDEIWMFSHTSCGTEYDSAKIENYGLIGYDENSARYDFVKYKFNENSVEADLHENHDIEFSEFAKENERIGNIFDNPELLQEEKHE